MRQGMIAVLAFALLAPAGAQGQAGHRARPPAAARSREATVRAEAEAFMAGYARDLLAGDRAAIAARYDRRGAWRVGGGQKSFERWTTSATTMPARTGGRRRASPGTTSATR